MKKQETSATQNPSGLEWKKNKKEQRFYKPAIFSEPIEKKNKKQKFT